MYYKGRSVIIDYEWYLHSYDIADKANYISEGLVPFEVYPYGDDIYVGYVHTDSKYKKADISELISTLDNIIENEDKYITNEIEDSYDEKQQVNKTNSNNLYKFMVSNWYICSCTIYI